ncbi:MAG: hypothetical protein AAFU85_32405 [Planctomycetota bacterium]
MDTAESLDPPNEPDMGLIGKLASKLDLVASLLSGIGAIVVLVTCLHLTISFAVWRQLLDNDGSMAVMASFVILMLVVGLFYTFDFYRKFGQRLFQELSRIAEWELETRSEKIADARFCLKTAIAL